MICPRFPRLASRLALAALIPVAAISLIVLPAQAQSPSSDPATAASPSATPAPSASPSPASPAPAPTSPSEATQTPPAPATPPAAAQTSPAPASQPEAAQTSPAPASQPEAAQAPPATTPAQPADPFGEEITLEPKKVLVVKGTANWDSAFDTLMDSFKVLYALLDKQGIKPNGNPMIVYTSTDDNGFTFLAEIPIEQEPKNLAKDMSIGKSPEGKALKFVHRGSYDNMDNTYEAITNHLDDKKLEAKDTFIEEYLTDPLKTSEDNLVINVYVPLK